MPLILIALMSLTLLSGCGSDEEAPEEAATDQKAEVDSAALAESSELKGGNSSKAVKDSLFQMPDTLNRFFEKYGVTGALILFDPQKNQYFYHNSERSDEPFSPGDGFLPLLSLMALESGALPDTATQLQWDGEASENEYWDRDQSLKEALQNRTLWFFEDLADKTGKKRIQYYLNRLEYGNRAAGTGKFWKNGKFKTNLQDHIPLLRGIYREVLPFSPKNIDFIKRYAFQHKKSEQYTLSTVKVLTEDGGQPKAWYSGYLIFSGEVPRGYYFTAFIDVEEGRKDPLGIAEAITIEVLKDAKLIPG